MNPIRHILICLLAVTLGQPVRGNAEDIDIYSGLSDAGFTPNVLMVMDNAASFSASASGGDCQLPNASGVPAANSLTGTSGGVEQCALYKVIESLPTNADGTARVNIGFMVYNANNIADYKNSADVCKGSNGGCLVYPLTPMSGAARTAMLNWITTWQTSGGGGGSYWIKAAGQATAATMQEAWAYYAGKEGLSGRDYKGIQPASGCQKNFVIFIGNAYETSSTPGDTGSASPAAALKAALGAEPPLITNTLTTYCGPYTIPDANHENGGFYADEWARFMNQFDLYSGDKDPKKAQSIITYTVGVLGAGCKAQYPALLENMADYGGGKYFPTTDYTSMVSSVMEIFNQIQAVNSVFASSSLPVSVNAQGTYLNQIYMGMFRPDAGAKPRWMGNLKQYSFYLDPDGNLQLGDSIKKPALNIVTGFVAPNAISYWTCSRATNPYLVGTTDSVPNVTEAQLADLGKQGQICTSDPVNGFWANAEEMTSSPGKGFDLADGELVEKGGAAQQMRLANLTNDYAAAPGSATNPRKLVTFCPSGDADTCKPDLTHATNAFATTNAALMPPNLPFGGASSVNISTIERSGDTVTVTTASNHGFASGSDITIANATPGDYNGNKPITKISNTQFTYPITENPPVMAAGTYQVFPVTPKTVTSLARPTTGSLSQVTTITATVSGHGFSNGNTVFISGSGEPQYNGAFPITVTGANTFTYSVPNIQETPPNATKANTGTATRAGSTASIASVARPMGSTTVTVTTQANHGFPAGNQTTLAGIEDASGNATAYNKKRNVTITGTNTFTFNFSIVGDVVGPGAVNNAGITASKLQPGTSHNISLLTRTGTTAKAITSTQHNFASNDKIVISGTPGSNESAYLGLYTALNASGLQFEYTLTTAPATPAAAKAGATMTASQGVGVPPDNTKLINWVRGEDNNGDEAGPACPSSDPCTPASGGINVRPSIHGDVLHSRPTVINYGGMSLIISNISDSDGTRTAATSETDADKIGPVDATAEIMFANGEICLVKRVSTAKIEYSSSNCGTAINQTVATTFSNAVVFYGDNGGVFHAVNGNQINPPGTPNDWPAPGREWWGFIPDEMFEKLNRLRTNSPQLELSATPGGILPTPQPKEYFVDGPVGVYQEIGQVGATIKAIIYLTMRRGGRVIYALDVSDPATPRLLWKADNQNLWKVNTDGSISVTSSGLDELGQTWSHPKVARVAGAPGEWVLIFGAGYDAGEDENPPTAADTMGRGIFALKYNTGELVWKAAYGADDSCTGDEKQASCTVKGMDYSIPADITLMDRDLDMHGYIDRMYAADTGGNIWRVDFEPVAGKTPDKWRVHKLAALGCNSGPCAIPPEETQRKFFYPPEVITTNQGYDAVIAGTGDREHPLYEDSKDIMRNYAVLLKDKFTGKDASGMKPITLDQLADIEDCANDYGFKYKLAKGEKVVNAPLVTAGSVYFGTNKPVNPAINSCTSTLGTAKGYKLEPFGCKEPASVEFAGGGLPPSPVSGVVNVQNADGTITQVPFLIGGGDQGCVGAACGGSALEGQKPTINVPTTRTRTYWYREGK
ncbi:MAG: hypothetical protein HZC43_01365 [Nitrosomonadales bacterium]|nr:hypothetical protein [Nitrosomonadales bacterium]